MLPPVNQTFAVDPVVLLTANWPTANYQISVVREGRPD
jgi:hypothetical protein